MDPLSPQYVSNYDRFPSTKMGPGHELWLEADIWDELAREALARSSRPVIVIDTYPGVDVAALIARVENTLAGFAVVDFEDAAARPIEKIDRALRPFLGEDRVFGVMAHLSLETFYDDERVRKVGDRVRGDDRPVVLVGWGASRAVEPDVLVLADLARWEIQHRQRAGAPNWRCANFDEDNLVKYKRGFFVEWRVADEHKRALFDHVDYCLDTNRGIADAALITGNTFREALHLTAQRPFRVVPFFDPGVWGGQWMKQVCGLTDSQENFAWCFDCVPEENSLLLEVDGHPFELPSLDLVLHNPRELLGDLTFARFGAEFPIRFDFLDTVDGGNLSLQVHPLTDYIQRTFGMNYTQDESYYLLDASSDAVVYLGLKTDVDRDAMEADLEAASRGEISFPTEQYVNTFPAKKHDHFLIPAGTVHCSGADSMVLEISATPFIFTFKMWDWDRLGLDGRPRPIHLDHAKRNIQWNRDTEWTRQNLVDQVQPTASGPGWVEERTGLHEFEFIEVRRTWFTDVVEHDTRGTVNVLNLVEGREAVIESPTGAFDPFVVHYAETFIVPASVGRYTIHPWGEARGTRCATVKASVRGTERIEEFIARPVDAAVLRSGR